MIVRVAHNILSPLGMSTAENYAAVKNGQSALTRYEGKWGLPEPFVASLVDRDKVEQAFAPLAAKAAKACSTLSRSTSEATKGSGSPHLPS